MKKPSISDYIQIAIALLILCTLILTLFNVVKQNDFNESTLRPWIAPEMLNAEVIIKNMALEYKIYLSNSGHSPAIDVIIYSKLDKNEDFPINDFKNKTYEDDTCKKSIIFPGQKKLKSTDQTKFTFQDSNLSENLIKNKMREVILKKKLYLHLYLTYTSPDGERYHLMETFRMKYIRDIEKGFHADWIYIWSSIEEP